MIYRSASAENNAEQLVAEGDYPWPRIGSLFLWKRRIRYSIFSDADTSEQVLIASPDSSVWPMPIPLPEDVWVFAWGVDLVEGFGGGTITDADIIVGRSGDDNAYMTVTAIEDGQTLGRKTTPAAAEYGPWYFADFSGVILQLDTTAGNINTMDQGDMDLFFLFAFGHAARSG